MKLYLSTHHPPPIYILRDPDLPLFLDDLPKMPELSLEVQAAMLKSVNDKLSEVYWDVASIFEPKD